jgi:predicted TIM-barrel fold metal-dependent hydrolase
LSDPSFDPYLAICEEYDIPVAIHTGGGPPGIAYRGYPKFRIPLGDPYLIEEALIKHPKLRVYVMHAGGMYYENLLALMESYQQVYADVGLVLWMPGTPQMYAEDFLRKAKKLGLIDRIMFGSDQMVWPQAIELSIKTLDTYDFLSEEDKRKIFYNNAVKFLKLTEKDLDLK